METRIEINGVWYIREDAINDSLDILEEEIDLTWTEECIYENGNYCFVASRIKKDDSEEFYDNIDIKFTNKQHLDRTEWTTEYWDNNSWFRGILENNPESLEHLREVLCDNGVKQFKMFLRKLVEVKWLKIEH